MGHPVPCVQRGALEEVASQLDWERPVRTGKAGKTRGRRRVSWSSVWRGTEGVGVAGGLGGCGVGRIEEV